METQRVNTIQSSNTQQTQQTHKTPAQITITVEQPLVYQKDAFNYVTYNLIGKDRKGSFAVRRRYSDFDLLRKMLSKRWLGIYLPPLSGKRADKNPLYFLKVFQSKPNQLKYAQRRCKFLKYFCEGVAMRPYLYEQDLFQIFIRGGPNFETAIQSCVAKEYKYVLKCYEQSFHSLIKQNADEMVGEQINISQHNLKLLKHYENILIDIHQKICKTTQAREQFNLQFSSTMKKTIPQYEQQFLLTHVNKNRQKLILNQQFVTKLAQLQNINKENPFQKLSDLVMCQIKETKAFIEAIQGRKQAEMRKNDLKQKITEKQNNKLKIQSGSFSFRALLKPGWRQRNLNELKLQIQSLKNDLVCMQKMIVIMVINGNFQIEQYRKRKAKQYRQVIRKLAQQQLTQLNGFKQLLAIPLAMFQ